jgi:mannose-1-phosphate guanylyltransferase
MEAYTLALMYGERVFVVNNERQIPMINIILCGGSGTRLWPLSRQYFPKQFCPLVGEMSLYQQTVIRNMRVCDRMIIVTSADTYYMAAEQLDRCANGLRERTSFLLEPCARNTAPAIALACCQADPDEVVIVTPSDHLVGDVEKYVECVAHAERLARQGYLVTFGITPSYPETGYGYIESGDAIQSAMKVKAFHEKPSADRAEEYLAKGTFFWNSGMFAFKASAFLEELKRCEPGIFMAARDAYSGADHSTDLISGFSMIRIDRERMERIPSKSVDYAVMEKSPNVVVVPSSFGWSDLGSFDSLYDALDKDERGNAVLSDVVNVDSSNNLVIGRSRKIATVGLSDSIIVDTPDALLVSKRGRSQDVKSVVEIMKKDGARNKALVELHSTVYRPWGEYTVLEEGDGFKIKRIVIDPGRRLSLQTHARRSEHWVVVSGVATVTIGREKKTVNSNESIYIPIGEQHRLENLSDADLVIIETQVGSYLEEDDIVRIDDDYIR